MVFPPTTRRRSRRCDWTWNDGPRPVSPTLDDRVRLRPIGRNEVYVSVSWGAVSTPIGGQPRDYDDGGVLISTGGGETEGIVFGA